MKHMENRRTDHISHFILRLAYCRYKVHPYCRYKGPSSGWRTAGTRVHPQAGVLQVHGPSVLQVQGPSSGWRTAGTRSILRLAYCRYKVHPQADVLQVQGSILLLQGLHKAPYTHLIPGHYVLSCTPPSHFIKRLLSIK